MRPEVAQNSRTSKPITRREELGHVHGKTSCEHDVDCRDEQEASPGESDAV